MRYKKVDFDIDTDSGFVWCRFTDDSNKELFLQACIDANGVCSTSDNGCDWGISLEANQAAFAALGLEDITSTERNALVATLLHDLTGVAVDSYETFVASADARETSVEIMAAIWAVAGENYDKAVKLWENGYCDYPGDRRELAAIVEIVTKNGLRDASDFCWGAAGSNWVVEAALPSSSRKGY